MNNYSVIKLICWFLLSVLCCYWLFFFSTFAFSIFSFLNDGHENEQNCPYFGLVEKSVYLERMPLELRRYSQQSPLLPQEALPATAVKLPVWNLLLSSSSSLFLLLVVQINRMFSAIQISQDQALMWVQQFSLGSVTETISKQNS